MGHVRDLPSNSLGVSVEEGFEPRYVLTNNGKRVMRDLTQAARKADEIYLATDPDREGEAIAWHLSKLLEPHTKASFHRVTFHEITRAAIDSAFSHAGELDTRKVDAQQARRVLDRLVGYQVSPLLWKHVRKGTSAGRVQSVALRLVCERERAILGFQPEEYWNLDALFHAPPDEQAFVARLAQLDGSKPRIPDAETATALTNELEPARFEVVNTERKPRKQYASPPFITSTLQQAGGGLRMSTRQTMRTAQQLYEGVDLGAEGSVGLITYMRTDSVNVAKEAQESARTFIGSTYGPDYVPRKPNTYRSRKAAQEAHEAIRPTDVTRTPDSLSSYLSPSQLRLYRLIWNRFVASQMSPAIIHEYTIEVAALGETVTHDYLFRAKSSEIAFPGFQRVYQEGRDEDAAAESESGVSERLPEVSKGSGCILDELRKEQKFTEPPRRYSEATLVRELEQNGVGRPSTYSTIVNTIQEREYAQKERGRLVPTPLGFQVNDYLVERLDPLFQVDFTARMEAELDKVEDGDVEWTGMLSGFYSDFVGWLGSVPISSVPASDDVRRFLSVFDGDIAWAEPVKRGRRTYDDKAFLESILEQVNKGEKPLTERQWRAVLGLAVRYREQLSDLDRVAEELGVRDTLDSLSRALAEEKEKSVAPEDPGLRELLSALEKVNWQPPVKRGRRTYDDARFYKSLAKQVDEGRALSEAQTNALRKLVVKYRTDIADFDALVERHGLETPENGGGDKAPDEAVAAMLALLDGVKEWRPPSTRGKRTYDDREFADSLRRQFAERGQITDRQVSALRKLLSRYAPQIPEYERLQSELGLFAGEHEPVKLDAVCPKCGSPLIKRSSRGREFIGCSGFPKCRYTASKLAEE
jgi:DNA topoisomerase-1